MDDNGLESTPIEENINIVEEMKNLEQQMSNPNIQKFKKTTYWNQLNKTEDNQNLESLLKEVVECLTRIESKLIQIENLLK